MPTLSVDAFIAYLLQLGHMAQQFVKWYETAKLGLDSERAKEVIRTILRDEIPQHGPTHQDDRLYDLGLMGVSKERALTMPMSRTTRKIVARMYDLIRYPRDHYDLRVLVTLRVTGEVLVAEQYRHVVEEMQRRFGITPAQSRFYYPHYAHDLKGQEGEGHSDAFDTLLESLITDEHMLAVAKEAAKKAFQIRYGFHSQFLPRRRLAQAGMRVTRWMAAAAAAVLIVVIGSRTLFRMNALTDGLQREREQRLVMEGHMAANEWLRECDARLIEWYRKTGDARWLAKVGTPDGPRELWGDGP